MEIAIQIHWKHLKNHTGGGYRVFEVDFAITKDNKIVLKHDWTSQHGLPEFENGYIPTLKEFKDEKIWEIYATLDIDALIQLMSEYPDIYIVVDSKDGRYRSVLDQFKQIVESAQNNKDCLDRMIIQIYNDDMYDAVESIYHFENYIYTLYQRGYNDLEQLATFCKEKNISVVVLPESWWNNDVKKIMKNSNLKVYLHTLNDENKILKYFELGVDGVYTDGFFSLR